MIFLFLDFYVTVTVVAKTNDSLGIHAYSKETNDKSKS